MEVTIEPTSWEMEAGKVVGVGVIELIDVTVSWHLSLRLGLGSVRFRAKSIELPWVDEGGAVTDWLLSGVGEVAVDGCLDGGGSVALQQTETRNSDSGKRN
ncbi:hypothetical protein LguiA_026681 [Lonicera macranthoides]